MIRPGTMALALLALTCGACGGSDGPNIPPATCTAGAMTLLGELDGQQADGSTAFSGWAFQQLTLPHSLDLPTDGSILHLEWSPLLSPNSSTATSGRVVMPASTPHAGETICAASGTFRYRDLSSNGNDYIFTLTDL